MSVLSENMLGMASLLSAFYLSQFDNDIKEYYLNDTDFARQFISTENQVKLTLTNNYT